MCYNGSVIYADGRRWVNPTIQEDVKKKKNYIMACLDWLASGSCFVIGSFNSAPLSRVTSIVCQSASPTELDMKKLDKILKCMQSGWDIAVHISIS